jgi:hypothetical protein
LSHVSTLQLTLPLLPHASLQVLTTKPLEFDSQGAIALSASRKYQPGSEGTTEQALTLTDEEIRRRS